MLSLCASQSLYGDCVDDLISSVLSEASDDSRNSCSLISAENIVEIRDPVTYSPFNPERYKPRPGPFHTNTSETYSLHQTPTVRASRLMLPFLAFPARCLLANVLSTIRLG